MKICLIDAVDKLTRNEDHPPNCKSNGENQQGQKVALKQYFSTTIHRACQEVQS